ncbi:MAG: hypothetical protein K6C12_06660 [Oscillospiraceae bacterium]|nr:hypothetical protein [Oscillospiraceae bacterium]
MRSILQIFRKIFLLAFLVFLILCCHSLAMRHGTTLGSASYEPQSDSRTEEILPTAAPNIALSSGSYSEDISDLAAAVTPEDLQLLDRFPFLQSADFSGSTCYEEIHSWSEQHPDIAVRYTVTLPDGQILDSSAESVNLSAMSPSDAEASAALLSYLPSLKTVELGSAQSGNTISADGLAAIAAACPNAAINYTVSIYGYDIPLTMTELDLSSMLPSQTAEVCSVLRCMNQLQLIHLGTEMNALGWDDISAVHEAAPNAVLDYTFGLFGIPVNLNAETLDLNHIAMNDEGAAVRFVLPFMKNLKTLDMDFCGVTNESMSAIRNDFPEVDVIWRIWFAEHYSVRTDVERILASSTAKGGKVTNQEAAKLQYCTKVKYLDLGHNEVLTDISFVRSMPDLEVLILAINDLSDITPLASCPKLEYLEINSTNVTDLSPLSNSMALRHLNIGRTAQMIDNTGDDLKRPRVSDISPLYGLKDLQRLWIGSVTAPSIPTEQIEHMKQCAPDCVINTEDGDPSQGSWRTTGERPDWVWAQWMETGVFNDPLNERYQLLREQFQYDLGDAAYSLAENDPKYKG